MTLAVHLLGRPCAERDGRPAYRFRSRKSWALLAYLRLAERPPSRAQVAALFFDAADDPLRALRWTLSEIRQLLADDGSVGGDPLALALRPGVVVDVDVLSHGSWRDATRLPGLGRELLEGIDVPAAAGFESWLLSERRRISATSEAILHEAALGHLSEGAPDTARTFAVRAVAMNPLEENHQALLIRLYRLAGADEAAARQFASYAALLDDELGVPPGVAVRSALSEQPRDREDTADEASIAAIVESGSSAVAAGVHEQGVLSLKTAVRLADGAGVTPLRIGSRLALAEALVHSLGGLDEEGLAALYEADRIAVDAGDHEAAAQARAELGYVDFLRARYDRAERWLTQALRYARGSASIEAKATTYLGSVESDRGAYPRSLATLGRAVSLSRAAGDVRREAFARSMIGRVHLIRGELATATEQLGEAIRLAERAHWLALLPWPQALLGEVQLLQGDLGTAERTLRQAFARACQLGDPCWEGMAARGLALVAGSRGRTSDAFDTLVDARSRANRLADPYVWLDAYILDAMCELGRRHGHPRTADWVETMRELASRTAMRELTVRSMLHAAALGHGGDAAAAVLLAEDIDNRRLDGLLDEARRAGELV